MATSTANGAAKPLVLYDLAPAPGIGANPHKTKILLKEKGIPYEQKFIDADNKPQDYVDLFRKIVSNPSARVTVPTIIDGDLQLTESFAIAQYLDTAYADKGNKLFPTDAKKLGLVNLFIELYNNNVTPHGFSIQTATTLQDFQKAKQALVHGLKVIDTFLTEYGDKSGPFLLGNDFSYAEAASLPFLYRLNRLLPHYRKISLQELFQQNKLQRLEKWAQAGLDRPSVKGSAPPDELILERGRRRVTVAIDDLK